MDALPIEETTGLPWASTAPGKMHACGHGRSHHHSAGGGGNISPSPACQFNGTVHLIFQPAEEAIGGADLMIKDGLFEQFPANASLALAQHARPACRQAGLTPATSWPSADTVKITITGYGGHGAHPEAHRRPDRRRCGAGDGPAEHCGAQRAAGERQWSASAPSRPVSPPTSFRRGAVMELSVRAMKPEIRDLLIKL
ncbi:M20/M25/M40 family metallo-hydrolase [Klebsiella pneumoniae subsp. pneumoniae]|nr:M20/M25/M40 family metallo-hydrolase [Klebsiella pneumoniae subsp. pneumoniae]